MRSLDLILFNIITDFSDFTAGSVASNLAATAAGGVIVFIANQLFRRSWKAMREHRLTAFVVPEEIQTTNDQAALIIGLAKVPVEEMCVQVKQSFREQTYIRALANTILDAPALLCSKDLNHTMDVNVGSREKLHFRTSYAYIDEAQTKGRMVTLNCDGDMPDDTRGGRKYIEHLNTALNRILEKLKHEGIHTIHLFYNGPMPVGSYISMKCIDEFQVYLYQFNTKTGRYYLLGNDNLVKDET